MVILGMFVLPLWHEASERVCVAVDDVDGRDKSGLIYIYIFIYLSSHVLYMR